MTMLKVILIFGGYFRSSEVISSKQSQKILREMYCAMGGPNVWASVCGEEDLA